VHRSIHGARRSRGKQTYLIHRGSSRSVVVVEGGLDAVHGGGVPLLGERDDPGDVGVGEEPRVLQVGGEALVHEHRPLDVAHRPERAAGQRPDEPLLVGGEGGEVGVHEAHPPRPRRRRLECDPGAGDHAELAQPAEDGVEQVSVELLGARHRLPAACTNCTRGEKVSAGQCNQSYKLKVINCGNCQCQRIGASQSIS
jgi:hypothetical protein